MHEQHELLECSAVHSELLEAHMRVPRAKVSAAALPRGMQWQHDSAVPVQVMGAPAQP